VAADHDADETAFVAGFEDGFVAFVSRQAGLDDDFLDLVGREVLEQGTCSGKAFQVISLMLVLAGHYFMAQDYHFVAMQQSAA
jgi:hypothetical protein